MKRFKTSFIRCLICGATAALTMQTAAAHGTSSGSAGGGMALLIFPAAAVLFVLFLVFNHRKKGWTVLVTGGAGYVGSALVPMLLRHGHRVVVLDLYPNGDDILKAYQGYEDLREIIGDFKDPSTLKRALDGCDAVIHLACITGGSACNPAAVSVRTTNLEAFGPLVRTAKSLGVKRFIFASTLHLAPTPVGAAADVWLTGSLPLEATGEFLEHKVKCEQVLDEERASGFITCTVRAAAVCGVAPSQRLDAGVNALARAGFSDGLVRITDAGRQRVPSIHIEDLAAFFLLMLNQPDARVDGKKCNAGSEILTILELAETVNAVLGGDLQIDVEPADDTFIYDPSWEEIGCDFDFQRNHTVADAVRDLVAAFRKGEIVPNP